jgi:hypothetical protein
MKLKNGMTVIAPCDGIVGIRKGDEFLVKKVCNHLITTFQFQLDAMSLFSSLRTSSNINFQDWIIKESLDISL